MEQIISEKFILGTPALMGGSQAICYLKEPLKAQLPFQWAARFKLFYFHISTELLWTSQKFRAQFAFLLKSYYK